jgi:hypothetical protein
MSRSIQVGSSFLDTNKKLHNPTGTRPSPCLTRSTYLHNVSAKSMSDHLYRMRLPPMESSTNLCHLYQAGYLNVESADLLSHCPFQAASWIFVRVKGHRERPYPNTLLEKARGSRQRCLSQVIPHLNDLGLKSSLSILALSKAEPSSNLMLTKALLM